MQRVGKGTTTPLGVWYAREWGLDNHLFDPYAEYNPFNQFKVSAMRVYKAGPGWDGFDDRSKDAVIVDYNLPLQPQLDAIKRHVVEHRTYLLEEGEISPWTEKRAQDYLFLLRVLDALQEISSTKFNDQKKIIGDEFYPETEDDKPSYKRRKAGGEAIKSALKLRDHDYIYLPMMTKTVTR